MKAARIRDLMARVERDRKIIRETYLPVADMNCPPPGMRGKKYNRIVRKIALAEAEIERLLMEGLQ